MTISPPGLSVVRCSVLSRPMRSLTRQESLAFLSQGTRTGKLATVRADGRPHVAPIWFVVEGDTIVFNTWHTSVKAKNLRGESRAALVVDYEEPPFGHVIVEGTVELSDDLGEVRRVAANVGARYMGADRAEEFGARNGVAGELVGRLMIEKLIGRDDISD